jgi:hypothetical protein
MLEAAPKTCLGFISAEHEQLDDVVYCFQHHVRPILELCLKYGKQFIPRNKDVWWASLAGRSDDARTDLQWPLPHGSVAVGRRQQVSLR